MPPLSPRIKIRRGPREGKVSKGSKGSKVSKDGKTGRTNRANKANRTDSLQDAALQDGDKRLQDGWKPTGLLVFLDQIDKIERPDKTHPQAVGK